MCDWQKKCFKSHQCEEEEKKENSHDWEKLES